MRESIRRRFVVLFVLAMLWALTINVPAQSTQTVFVSTFDGETIVKVDVATGYQTVILYNYGFRPEGIVVGPDGRLYICDSINHRIFRSYQDGSGLEIVYQHSGSNTPTGPEGPRFVGPDLYFNTRDFENHTGVWRIPGVAALLYGASMPRPQQIANADQTGITFGEGLGLTPSGDLLIVDRSNSRILKKELTGLKALTPVITANLDSPMDVDMFNGEIVVSNLSSRQINRYRLSDGQFLGTLAVGFQNLWTPA